MPSRAEAEPDPVAALLPQISPFAAASANRLQAGHDHGRDHGWFAFAPVFPGEIAVPVAPQHAGHCRERGSRQREIADRNHARTFARAGSDDGRGRQTCRAARHSRAADCVCSWTQLRKPDSSVRCDSGSKLPKGSASAAPLRCTTSTRGRSSATDTIAAERPIRTALLAGMHGPAVQRRGRVCGRAFHNSSSASGSWTICPSQAGAAGAHRIRAPPPFGHRGQAGDRHGGSSAGSVGHKGHESAAPPQSDFHARHRADRRGRYRPQPWIG